LKNYPNEKQFNLILALYYLLNGSFEKSIVEFDKSDFKNDLSILFYLTRARFELKIESELYDPNFTYNLFD
jgi:hypothetical protein